MNDLDSWVSKEYLLEAAFAAGFKVSQDQLVRWYRAGLLPRPQQIHLGRHGSQIIFPKSAINQLIEICRIHKTEKRLEYIAWRLWWNGVDIDFEAVRNFLRSITEEWDKCRSKYFFLDSDAVETE